MGQILSHRDLCDFHRHQFEKFLETVHRASKKSNTTLNDQTRLELVLNHFEPSEFSYFTKQYMGENLVGSKLHTTGSRL